MQANKGLGGLSNGSPLEKLQKNLKKMYNKKINKAIDKHTTNLKSAGDC